jgi:hypothetical protein
MGALARVPIRSWPLAFNGILTRALFVSIAHFRDIFDGDSESTYPRDPGRPLGDSPVTCRGRPRDKCGTNGRAESSLKLDRPSDLRFSL